MPRSVKKRLRSGTIALIDRFGLRDVAATVRGRWSPSYTSRRDHRDMSELRSVVAAVLGGGGRGVDIGANQGSISSMFFEVSPDRNHLLIEPVVELAERLAARYPSAEVANVVCAAERGVVEFNVAVDQMTRSSVHASMARSGGRVDARSIPTASLDELVGDDPVALVKIDVEGGELAVLQGAERTLASQRPVVVFEHARTVDVDAAQSAAVFEFLDRQRFRLFDIDGRPVSDVASFRELVDVGRVWTFVAVPVDRAQWDSTSSSNPAK